MDIGGFKQSAALISLHFRLSLSTKTNIKCSPLSTRSKALGMKVMKFLIPLFIRHVTVILGFLVPPWE